MVNVIELCISDGEVVDLCIKFQLTSDISCCVESHKYRYHDGGGSFKGIID